MQEVMQEIIEKFQSNLVNVDSWSIFRNHDTLSVFAGYTNSFVDVMMIIWCWKVMQLKMPISVRSKKLNRSKQFFFFIDVWIFQNNSSFKKEDLRRSRDIYNESIKIRWKNL